MPREAALYAPVLAGRGACANPGRATPSGFVHGACAYLIRAEETKKADFATLYPNPHGMLTLSQRDWNK
jgi:hypothetical protein